MIEVRFETDIVESPFTDLILSAYIKKIALGYLTLKIFSEGLALFFILSS